MSGGSRRARCGAARRRRRLRRRAGGRAAARATAAGGPAAAARAPIEDTPRGGPVLRRARPDHRCRGRGLSASLRRAWRGGRAEMGGQRRAGGPARHARSRAPTVPAATLRLPRRGRWPAAPATCCCRRYRAAAPAEVDACLRRPIWYPRLWRQGQDFVFAGGERQTIWRDGSIGPSPPWRSRSRRTWRPGSTSCGWRSRADR